MYSSNGGNADLVAVTADTRPYRSDIYTCAYQGAAR